MKAAGHELNGLKAYYNTKVEGLHYPFMTLLSYLGWSFFDQKNSIRVDSVGYRLIATPKLPLSSTSLIYGSADAGKTVRVDNPELNKVRLASF